MGSVPRSGLSLRAVWTAEQRRMARWSPRSRRLLVSALVAEQWREDRETAREGAGVVAAECQRLGQQQPGRLGLLGPGVEHGQAQAQVHRLVVGLELGGLLEQRDGFVVAAFIQVEERRVVARLEVRGRRRQRRLEVRASRMAPRLLRAAAASGCFGASSSALA